MSGCDIATVDVSAGEYTQPTLQNFENELTKRRAKNLLEACNLYPLLYPTKIQCPPRQATPEEVELVHSPEYVAKMLASSQTPGDAGSYAHYGPGSTHIALTSVASAIDATEAVIKGEIDNAYVLVRPPGHHAERDQGMGFCVFNNIAIAAKSALRNAEVSKVAIVDFDVHHGNGTQQAFYDSSACLFVSIHEDGLYPLQSGSLDEMGEGDGLHCNINIPLPPGSGTGAYLYAFEKVVEPALRAFGADVIFVSAGFDASNLDPLGHMMLTSSVYGQMMKKIMEVCSKVVCVHEGGYSEVAGERANEPLHSPTSNYLTNPLNSFPSLGAVPFCLLRVVEALAGVEKSNVVDPCDEECYLYPYQGAQEWQKRVVDLAWARNARWLVHSAQEKEDVVNAAFNLLVQLNFSDSVSATTFLVAFKKYQKYVSSNEQTSTLMYQLMRSDKQGQEHNYNIIERYASKTDYTNIHRESMEFQHFRSILAQMQSDKVVVVSGESYYDV